MAPEPEYVEPSPAVEVEYVEPAAYVYINPNVQVIEGYDYPVFFSGGLYWRQEGSVWYSSSYHDRGWGASMEVPVYIRTIDRPTQYVHYHADVHARVGQPGYRYVPPTPIHHPAPPPRYVEQPGHPVGHAPPGASHPNGRGPESHPVDTHPTHVEPTRGGDNHPESHPVETHPTHVDPIRGGDNHPESHPVDTHPGHNEPVRGEPTHTEPVAHPEHVEPTRTNTPTPTPHANPTPSPTHAPTPPPKKDKKDHK